MKARYSLLLMLLALLLPGANPAQLLSQQAKKPQDKGGIEFLIAVKADKSQLDESIKKTLAVIQNRCDRLKIYCKLQRQADDKFMLRFSSSMATQRIKNILLAEGFELRAIVSNPFPESFQRYDTEAEAAIVAIDKEAEVLPYLEEEDGSGPNSKSFVVVKRAMVTGNDVTKAEAISETGRNDDYQIWFHLKPEAGKRFSKWTGANINNYLAVVYNKKITAVAYIKSRITEHAGEISGRFTHQQADDIAKVLMSGNLPAPLELLEEKVYRP